MRNEWIEVNRVKWSEMSDLIKPYQNEWIRWDLNELKWIEVKWGEMSELMELTWNNPMRMVLWSREVNPMRMTWMNPMRKSLSKWMDSLRNEWIEWIERFEMKWVNWRSDLEQPYGNGPMVRRRCPYESDLSEPNGNLPMSWEWVSLSIWLDWSQWESPYGQLNECPYQSDLMWVKMSVPIKMNGIDEIWTRISEMKWIEVKWVIWRILLCEPYGKVPMVSRRWTLWKWLGWTLWESPYQMNGFNEKWMNWSE